MELGIGNRLALVTASSDGIGRGIAQALAAEAAKVVVVGRNGQRLDSACKEISAFGSIATDLSSHVGVEALIKEHEKRFGIPEILVVNTAGPPKGKFSDLTYADWTKGFETIWGPAFHLIQWVLPAMQKKKWGRIVLSTSLSAKEPIASMMISGALRAGLSNLVKGLAREVAGDGVTVNAVLPGWTNTTAVQKMGSGIQAVVEQIPMKRLGEISEMGSVVAFLCSERAAYLTGQSIPIEGGILKGI